MLCQGSEGTGLRFSSRFTSDPVVKRVDFQMDSKPSVDVILRTKDRPLFVRRALRSILHQVWKNIFIVIVNDGGSIAPIEELVSSLDLDWKNRVNIISNSRPVGRAEALNLGVRAGNARFVAIHDDDDSWSPHFISAMLFNFEIIAKRLSHVGGIASQLRRRFELVVNDAIIPVRTVDVVSDKEPIGLLHMKRYLRFEEDVFPIQLLLAREAVHATGPFNAAFEVAEDREFLSRLLCKYEIAIHRRPLAVHHVRVDFDETEMSNSVQDRDWFLKFQRAWENDQERLTLGRPIHAVRGTLE